MPWKVKPSKRDSAPTLVATVGAESFPAQWRDGNGGTPHVLGQAHIVIRRRTRRGWKPWTEHACLTAGQVWEVLDALGTSGRRVYVVAAVASDLLTQLGWWDRVEAGTYTLRRRAGRNPGDQDGGGGGNDRRLHPLILHGRPDVVGYTFNHSNYRWVSVTNWADCSLSDMAKQVGYYLPNLTSLLDKWEANGWPAGDQARVMMLYINRLMNWWLENECGTWRDTPGAAAWSSWLRRTEAGSVTPHTDDAALILEGKAVFGGRASAFFLGSVGDTERWGELADSPKPSAFGLGIRGPLHRFDVRAMYPSLLAARQFPSRLIRVDRKCSRAGLKAGMRGMLAVAHVRLRSRDGYYPKRIGAEVVYPTGTFDTYLTTPELTQAVERGHLQKVWEIAWYSPGTPFRVWAEWALRLRTMPGVANDPVARAVVKTLAVSFGGKLARRKVGWEDRPRMLPVKWWGDWWAYNTKTGEGTQYRALAGRVQEMIRSEHRPGTFSACFAFLTAYGRVLMNQVREVCGKREVIWQDTDGVMVTDTGRQRLEASAHYHPTQFGKLRYENTFANVRLITPKHYWADGAWVLSGVHDGFEVTDGDTAHHVVTVNPARSAIEPVCQAVYRSVQHVRLEDIEPGVEIGYDGWAIPPKMVKHEPPEGINPVQLKLWPDDE